MLTDAACNTAGVFLPLGNTASNANGGATALIAILELIIAAGVTVAARPAQLSLSQPRQAQACGSPEPRTLPDR